MLDLENFTDSTASAKKKFSYRKIGFDHHFAVEPKINECWPYFDTDKEPVFPKGRHLQPMFQ